MLVQTFSVLYTRCVLQNPLKDYKMRLSIDQESLKYARESLILNGGSAVFLMNILFAAKFLIFDPTDIAQNLHFHFLFDRLFFYFISDFL